MNAATSPVHNSCQSAELNRVFGHLIQNAQEACDVHGHVQIHVTSNNDDVEILIRDNGHGMNEAFINEQLFQPFESTKGLTGMGIGVFESREYIRQLKGDISVSSEPEVGTEFTVTVPLDKSGH